MKPTPPTFRPHASQMINFKMMQLTIRGRNAFPGQLPYFPFANAKNNPEKSNFGRF